MGTVIGHRRDAVDLAELAESAARSGYPAVQLRATSKRYGAGPAAVDALRGVDLEVWPGEFVVFLGPSGAPPSISRTIGRLHLGGKSVQVGGGGFVDENLEPGQNVGVAAYLVGADHQPDGQIGLKAAIPIENGPVLRKVEVQLKDDTMGIPEQVARLASKRWTDRARLGTMADDHRVAVAFEE